MKSSEKGFLGFKEANKSQIQGGLTSVYKTEIVQNLVHHEPHCLYTYISAGYYEDNFFKLSR